jgi:hypothetical protein
MKRTETQFETTRKAYEQFDEPSRRSVIGRVNSIFVDEGKNGIVCFWDHETTEITTLAVTFGDFLELLQPFDISSVKLKPGQVKRVWVDPEFLERLKK